MRVADARLGTEHVTSADVDPYLTAAAAERLDSVGLRPTVLTVDATSTLPGRYDRIVATVAVRPVPTSWLVALRPGGRLVTTIAGTGLILTADKTDDGGAIGRIEWDRAGFMVSRHGPGYPPPLWERNEAARDQDGEEVSQGRYPVPDVMEAWELWSMITVLAPGIEHHYSENGDLRTAWRLHPDGSWVRASAVGSEAPVVHQSGMRRLWDLLDEIREMWLREGSLPVYGASATITPDGGIHLRRGRWRGGGACDGCWSGRPRSPSSPVLSRRRPERARPGPTVTTCPGRSAPGAALITCPAPHRAS